ASAAPRTCGPGGITSWPCCSAARAPDSTPGRRAGSVSDRRGQANSGRLRSRLALRRAAEATMTRFLGVCLALGVLAGGARGQFEEDLLYAGRPLRDWLRELKAPDVAVRYRASRVLRFVGPEAREAAPALLMALKNDDIWLRARVAWALARLGPRQVP